MQKRHYATRRDRGATFSAVVIITPDLDYACECVTRHTVSDMGGRVIHEAEFKASNLGTAAGAGDRYTAAMLNSAIHKFNTSKESV